jgi:hypothetical protein
MRRVRLEGLLGHRIFFSGLKLSGGAMADSVWRGFRPFVRWTATFTKIVFYLFRTQVWQVLHVWA